MKSNQAISTPALSASGAKLLGTEFERTADREAVSRAILRLTTLGAPWGGDRDTARIALPEWERALGDLPANVIDGAVTAWLRLNSHWPKPADIRKLAEATLMRQVDDAADRFGMHPRRIKPAETMQGFLFIESPLRGEQTWRRFLNSIHPTAEHAFFQNAKCVVPHEPYGFTSFEADYVREKFGRQLTEIFRRPVGLGIGPNPCRDVEWTSEPYSPPTEEAKARVSEMVAAFVARNRVGDVKTPRRGVNLDGASPQFLDLVEANHGVTDTTMPDGRPIAPGSPYAGADDFSAHEDVQT